MKKHINYQQGILTIDAHPIADASLTNVRDVIRAFTNQSNEVVSTSIDSIEILDDLIYLEEHLAS